MEAGILDHRAEQVLDLGGQGKKAREVTLLRGSDDHPSSLTDEANVARLRHWHMVPNSACDGSSVLSRC